MCILRLYGLLKLRKINMYKNGIFLSFFTLLFIAVMGMQNSDGQMLIAQEEEYSPGHTVFTGYLPEYQVVKIEVREDEAGLKNYSGYFTMRGIQFGARTETPLSPDKAKEWANRLKPIAVKHKSCRDLL